MARRDLLDRAVVREHRLWGAGVSLAPLPTLVAAIYLTVSRGAAATALVATVAFIALTSRQLGCRRRCSPGRGRFGSRRRCYLRPRRARQRAVRASRGGSGPKRGSVDRARLRRRRRSDRDPRATYAPASPLSAPRRQRSYYLLDGRPARSRSSRTGCSAPSCYCAMRRSPSSAASTRVSPLRRGHRPLLPTRERELGGVVRPGGSNPAPPRRRLGPALSHATHALALAASSASSASIPSAYGSLSHTTTRSLSTADASFLPR
jgi:hypothetical protein